MRGASQLVKKPFVVEAKGRVQAGELEGAEPASNGIECPAMPCIARFAASEARTFVPHSGAKVTAFLQEQSDGSRRFLKKVLKKIPLAF